MKIRPRIFAAVDPACYAYCVIACELITEGFGLAICCAIACSSDFIPTETKGRGWCPGGSVHALLRDQLTGLCISRAYGCTAVACVAVHDVPSAGGVTVAQRSAILSPSKRQRTNP